MLRRFRHSLVARITLLGVALALIGIAGRMAALQWVLRPDIQELVSSQQLALATYMARDIDGKILARQGLVERLAQALPRELLARPAELEMWLAERYALDPLFSLGVIVVPPDGEALIAEAPTLPGRRALKYRDSDWFVAVRDSGRPAIGRPLRGRASNQPLLIMAAPVLDGKGRLLAVLAGVTALAAPGFLDLVQE